MLIGDHPDEDVRIAFRALSDALCQWERATGRDSVLIYREAAGHVTEIGRGPSAFALRLSNGIPMTGVDDLPDTHFLAAFTDSGVQSS